MKMNAGLYSRLTDEERIEPAFLSLHHEVTQIGFAELGFSRLGGAGFGRVSLDPVSVGSETRNLYVQSMTSNFTGPGYL
jgi:hypothetical protein